MSFRKQYIEWDVPLSEVQQGVPVGFEVELSQNRFFSTKNYRLTTFEDNDSPFISDFYYSLDSGSSWIQYPQGEVGNVFYQAFKMRLVLNAAHASSIIAYTDGVIYKLSADLRSVHDTFQINVDNIDVGYGGVTDSLFLVGEKTLYRISTKDELVPYDNSLNVNGDDILGLLVDEDRNSFWQINRSSVVLKDLDGEKIYSIDIPNIDVDSSSSSSSSIDSSSSSSSSLDSSSSSSSSL